jgi:hypothetical protein
LDLLVASGSCKLMKLTRSRSKRYEESRFNHLSLRRGLADEKMSSAKATALGVPIYSILDNC